MPLPAFWNMLPLPSLPVTKSNPFNASRTPVLTALFTLSPIPETMSSPNCLTRPVRPSSPLPLLSFRSVLPLPDACVYDLFDCKPVEPNRLQLQLQPLTAAPITNGTSIAASRRFQLNARSI